VLHAIVLYCFEMDIISINLDAEWRIGMKVQDIKDIAKKQGINAGKLNKTDLIKAIQVAEGNNACFATSFGETCGQMKCLWRADCK
jgi:hypothetical protein